MDLTNLDVAIVGAGYAGAAAAKALSDLGASVTVYEQATQIGEVGAGIGLRPSSMDRFRQWGILDRITAVSSASDYFEILTGDAHPIMKEAWPEIDRFGLTTHLIHRRDFIDALVGALPEGMVQLDRRLTRIDDGARPTLVFADGSTATADLVIGADGIRSTVRSALFSDAPPVFAGEHAYRIVIDADSTHGLASDDNLRMYIGHGTKVYFLPLRHRGQVSFDITVLDSDSTWAPTVTREQLLAAVEGFDERIVAVTRELDISQLNARAVYDIDPIESWHTDAVVLIGDAAHSMCHHQGQGANSAILDAGVLADRLAQASSIPEALSAYQGARKPVTDELQRISRQGWTEEEIDDVFPGQKPATVSSRD